MLNRVELYRQLHVFTLHPRNTWFCFYPPKYLRVKAFFPSLFFHYNCLTSICQAQKFGKKEIKESIYEQEKLQQQTWFKHFQEQNQVVPNNSCVSLLIGPNVQQNSTWEFISTQMQNWNQLMAKLQLKKSCLQPWLQINCKHIHACVFTPGLFPRPFWGLAPNISLTHVREENRLVCNLF